MAEYTFAQNPFPLGSTAPHFQLKGVDSSHHGLEDYEAKPFLVVSFVCNHCPYVQAYWGRLIALQDEFFDRGVQFLGINSNDSSRYPEDSFEKMVETHHILNLNFPYLHDESQQVAHAYHAERTPQIFVFNAERKLVYTGGIDDSYSDSGKVMERPLYEALKALVEDRQVPKPQAHFIGCSIKWKE
ncbi:MAG: alkyl hydroperoxide reductase/thiol specific antioxidant/Mal allergen [uncultured bacterium]|nr:MAG: alkyl hydroperoxide reductase/thiol specific antioxidant/Mal allergen [uncultured bacterium]KKT76089.1 MAG: Thioredoxin-like protein [Candidatus Peregrinibacteria bacterium GW2011_GWA2_44_7]